MRENPANAEKVSWMREADDLHNRSWNCALKAITLFMNNAKGNGRAGHPRDRGKA
jgi:hypothetical protein